MRRRWAAGVMLSGLLLVGIVYGCIWYALPNKPLATEWPTYGLLLLAPYLLAAIGCLLCRGWFIRVLAVATVLCGIMMAIVGVIAMWPDSNGNPPQDLLGAVWMSALLMVCQYYAGAIAACAGYGWRG